MPNDAKRIDDGAADPVRAPPLPHDPEWSPTIVRIPDAMEAGAPPAAAAKPKPRLSLGAPAWDLVRAAKFDVCTIADFV